MLKLSFTLFFVIIFLGTLRYFTGAFFQESQSQIKHSLLNQRQALGTGNKDSLRWSDGLIVTRFAGPELTPSPACIATAPTGEVFVGVDMIGSLGKTPGKGKILRLVD